MQDRLEDEGIGQESVRRMSNRTLVGGYQLCGRNKKDKIEKREKKKEKKKKSPGGREKKIIVILTRKREK